MYIIHLWKLSRDNWYLWCQFWRAFPCVTGVCLEISVKAHAAITDTSRVKWRRVDHWYHYFVSQAMFLWNKSKTYKMTISNIYIYILIVQSEYTLKVVANCKPRLTPREIFQHLAPQLTLLVQINVFSITKEPPKGASILIAIKHQN